jgi:hypothetical protein
MDCDCPGSAAKGITHKEGCKGNPPNTKGIREVLEDLKKENDRMDERMRGRDPLPKGLRMPPR